MDRQNNEGKTQIKTKNDLCNRKTDRNNVSLSGGIFKVR